jgi:molybdopterin synthase catalytic subunit
MVEQFATWSTSTIPAWPKRWASIDRVAIVHRVGRLQPGEVSAVIALSAAHREEVFDALRYAIDRLKEIVPIWKKEVWADGAEWKGEW